jgi:hypothetical protein
MTWRSNIHGWVRTSMVVVLLSYAAAGYIIQSELRERVLALEAATQEIRSMQQTLTTTWQHQGNPVTVSTPRNSGETTEAWAERHRAAVAALKAEFPEDQ